MLCTSVGRIRRLYDAGRNYRYEDGNAYHRYFSQYDYRRIVPFPLSDIASLQIGTNDYDTAIFIAVLNALHTPLPLLKTHFP